MILLREIIRGNPRAIGRAISLVEDGGPEARRFMKDIGGLRKRAPVVGLTGAPGVGKSTLADRLIAQFRGRGLKVGVVAIDPTSPFTGGAVLGDRIRMIRHSTDPNVYVRSMASRGHRGGLAKAAGDVCTILTAAGMDVILLETVGVGQAEVDVIHVADLVLVILTPGSGDDIQAFKAGIMEIADIFVINKSDVAGASALEAQIRSMVELGDPGGIAPPVFRTSAAEDRGIEPLGEEILKRVRA